MGWWIMDLVERSNCIRGLSVKETTHMPCFLLCRYYQEGEKVLKWTFLVFWISPVINAIKRNVRELSVFALGT